MTDQRNDSLGEEVAHGGIWFLRLALSAVLFSIAFFGMGYTDPNMRLETYAIGSANLLIVAAAVAAYWYWPRRIGHAG